MARADTQLKFRVPDGLKQRLEDAATANKRSLNAEIIAALEMSYPEPVNVEAIVEKLTPEQRQQLKKLMERMEKSE